MPKKKDLTGVLFGRLSVIKESEERTSSGEVMWICKCECGNEKSVASRSLTKGLTKSCGCLQREVVSKSSSSHGKCGTRLHEIWRNMKRRCYNENATGYDTYGGKGVSICNEWLEDFENFYKWSMKNGYSDNLTIDRINVDGDYEQSNCRWATMKVQQNNKTTNKIIIINGISKTLKEWSDETGIKSVTIQRRLALGWKEEDLLKPVRKHKEYKKR